MPNLSEEIPSGMVEVSKERFFELLYAEKRDIMPRSEQKFTAWEGNHTRESWGWASEGWSPSGKPKRYAVLAAIAKTKEPADAE